jgi:hypothetical protein
LVTAVHQIPLVAILYLVRLLLAVEEKAVLELAVALALEEMVVAVVAVLDSALQQALVALERLIRVTTAGQVAQAKGEMEAGEALALLAKMALLAVHQEAVVQALHLALLVLPLLEEVVAVAVVVELLLAALAAQGVVVMEAHLAMVLLVQPTLVVVVVAVDTVVAH